MREIKFRAYDKQKLQWIDIFDINCFGDILSVGYSYLGEPGTIINDKVFLMQYTGINDKNGREIYQGDYIEGVIYGSPRKGIVDWSKDGLWLVSGDPIQDYYFPELEVIGNLYENSELIIKNMPF